jgi:hypothetical protein
MPFLYLSLLADLGLTQLTGFSLRESLSRLDAYNARFSCVSFLLNLDSARLPGIVCVNPHHDFSLHNNARFPVSLLLDLDPA